MPSPLKSLKALLVDDAENILHTLGMRLEAQGAEVRTAGDGVEAVETAAEFRPDVILLDLKMPRMGGLAALREIRKLDFSCQVVVLTAHGTTANAVEAMREGAVDFLEKPLDPDQLSVLFQKVAARSAPKAPAPGGPGPPGGGPAEGGPGPTSLSPEELRREAERQFIGEAPGVRRVRALLLQAAPTEAPILLAPGGTPPLSPSTARPFRKPCSRARSSVTSAAPSRERRPNERGRSRWPMGERSFSTRWPKCRPTCRSSFSASSKPAGSASWAGGRRWRWTFASWRRGYSKLS